MIYINQNSQIRKYYSDCQLVNAINMCRYLTGKQYYKQDSKEYRELAELAGCLYGSCINIEKVHEKLGLVEDQRFEQALDLKEALLKRKLPIECSVFHSKHGLHSCAIIEVAINHKEDELVAVKVPNFYYETDPNMWILFDKFKNFLRVNPDKTEPRYIARNFKLR